MRWTLPIKGRGRPNRKIGDESHSTHSLVVTAILLSHSQTTHYQPHTTLCPTHYRSLTGSQLPVCLPPPFFFVHEVDFPLHPSFSFQDPPLSYPSSIFPPLSYPPSVCPADPRLTVLPSPTILNATHFYTCYVSSASSWALATPPQPTFLLISPFHLSLL